MDSKFTPKLFLLFITLFTGINGFAQNYEYDDLYFSNDDAEVLEQKNKNKVSTPNNQPSTQDPYSITQQKYQEHPDYEGNDIYATANYQTNNNSRYTPTAYYDEDDYYYSNQIQRFYTPVVVQSYCNPVYTRRSIFYDPWYDPWGPSYTIGWNNNAGWYAGYNWGWGGYYNNWGWNAYSCNSWRNNWGWRNNNYYNNSYYNYNRRSTQRGPRHHTGSSMVNRTRHTSRNSTNPSSVNRHTTRTRSNSTRTTRPSTRNNTYSSPNRTRTTTRSTTRPSTTRNSTYSSPNRTRTTTRSTTTRRSSSNGSYRSSSRSSSPSRSSSSSRGSSSRSSSRSRR